ncbi:hypothetical protein MBLNU459_g4649t1 [Dothideomycetes sp. NU459]
MRIAEILSDLASLRACDASAALALVSARPHAPSELAAQFISTSASSIQEDVHLIRAQDLLLLHASVKVAHHGNIDSELMQAREDVNTALH